MAFRSDVSIQWNLSPRIITIEAPSTNITIQDLHDTLREHEAYAENMVYPQIISSAGKESLGGGVRVGLTSTLLDAKVAFQARKTSSHEGIVTSTDATGRILIDSTATYITDAIEPGAWVVNYADGSICSVLTIDSETQLTTDLLGDGIDNQFAIGDAYRVQNIIQCEINGGNLVALDSLDAEMSPILPTAGVQVVRTSSASATLQELQDIQYSSYNGGVTLDESTTNTGTSFPVGTPRMPASQMDQALEIANLRGFTTIFIRGDTTIDADDVITGFKFIGQSQTETSITINENANAFECNFNEASISGSLDGGCHLSNCSLGRLDYVDGFIDNCVLNDRITLFGDAHFFDCWSGVPGLTTPTIDFNGSPAKLAMRNYNGGIKLMNKTGGEPVSIDMNSGQVILDSTVVSGTIVVRGVGNLYDYSTGSAVVSSNGLINTTTISEALEKSTIDLKFLIETKFGSHSGHGSTFFWDPFNGSDANNGQKPTTACATFAHIHDTLVTDGGHDVVCLVGTPATSVITERITISKDDVSLRGPGRYVFLTPTDAAGPTLTITGRGVSVSGMIVSTHNTGSCDGIVINVPATSVELREVGAYRCTGKGVNIYSGSLHLLDDVLAYQNGGDGVYLSNTTGVQIEGGSVISGNGGYGIKVVATALTASVGVVLADCVIGYNTTNELYIGAGALTTVARKSCLLDQSRIENYGILSYLEETLQLTNQANRTNAAVVSGTIGTMLSTVNDNVGVLKNAMVAGTALVLSGSTTTTVKTNLTQSDSFFDGMLITVVGSAGAAARTISYYQNSSGSIHIEEPLPFTPAINDLVYVLAARNDRPGSVK